MNSFFRNGAGAPESAQAWMARAGVHARRGEFDAVIACCDEALALQPSNVNAFFNKGVALRAVSDRGGTVTLHVASFDQSSSILPMHIHRAIYPDIVPAGTVEVKATPLDELLTEHELDFGKLTLWCIDVQGVEHLVLRGARRVLDFVQGVQVEVNFAEMYRGGAAIEDIESLLNAAGFQRVALISGYHPTWGDAFYIRTSPAAVAAHSPAAPV